MSVLMPCDGGRRTHQDQICATVNVFRESVGNADPDADDDVV
jgi:hypothetical protein